MSKTFEWHGFGNVKSCSDLEDYLTGREYEHSDYCHYTSLKVINSILGNRTFWLSNVSGFNDTVDSDQFDNPQLYYSLCFSTGVNENLPLWYMYSGMKGDGGRLRFTKAQTKRLVNNGQYALYECHKNTDGSKTLGRKVMDLEKNKDMILYFKDILYVKREGEEGQVSLKYNTMTNYNLPQGEFKNYVARNKGFIKGLIWYYEKETRLLVKLIRRAEHAIEEKKDYVVLLAEGKAFESAWIDLAPQAPTVPEVIDSYAYIAEHFRKAERVKPSKYHGTIQMEFCKKCTR